ncbi:MAG: hypothetical protein NTY67_10650 [Cyanobacteria bacterium]|nr:hypothetical protein [Cyanobacteriota bacterium]
MIGSREPRPQPRGAERHDLNSPLRRRLGGLLSVLLALGLLLLPGSVDPGEALGLPGRSPGPAPSSGLPLAASAPSGLQEVAPPPAVQQLQEALAGREPRVEILAPADDTILPPGPWTLRLRVHDWPLVDAGPLGLGPHLVVQLDDEPPMRLTSTDISLPALTPGSHRLTVFAARPWGEAAKNPGAWRQIRLHRSAANPLALPQPGRAQLIAVSPPAATAAEPLLLDWLLLDAPLQNLRSDDGRWRLRVTINGDGFVIDRQTPLWLRGWMPGRNAIRLELLDSRGEPLNPPYNSLVREVELGPSQPAARWQKGPLSAGELAILLGEAPAEVDQGPSGAETEPPISGEEGSAQSGGLDPAPVATPGVDVMAAAAASATGKATATRTGQAEPAAQTPAPAPLTPASEQAERPDLTAQPDALGAKEGGASSSFPPPLAPSAAPSEPLQPEGLSNSQVFGAEAGRSPEAPARSDVADLSASAPLSSRPDMARSSLPENGSRQSGTATASPDDRSPALSPRSTTPLTLSGGSAAGRQAAASSAPGAGALPESSQSSPSSGLNQPFAAPEPSTSDNQRLRPSSSIGGSAREQVNPDGTMVRPPRRGPLAGLREQLLP